MADEARQARLEQQEQLLTPSEVAAMFRVNPKTVTLVGGGILIEEHARVADTIAYEVATGLNTRSGRARRVTVNG